MNSNYETTLNISNIVDLYFDAQQFCKTVSPYTAKIKHVPFNMLINIAAMSESSNEYDKIKFISLVNHSNEDTCNSFL